MNNKGLSTVVATVLILLLTVMAITVLAGFVIPFVKNQLQKSTECLNVQERFSFEVGDGKNCFNSTQGLLLSVKAKGDSDPNNEIAGFDIILKGLNSGKAVGVRTGKTFLNMTMADGTSTLMAPNTGEFYSYKYQDGNIYSSAELKTVLMSGKTCELSSDKIDIKGC